MAKGEMKTKIIGQCKHCGWWKRYDVTDHGICEYYHDPTSIISENYGCWYWKKNKETEDKC